MSLRSTGSEGRADYGHGADRDGRLGPRSSVRGQWHGLALLAYVLFLGAVALVVLAGRLRAALPSAPPFERLLKAPLQRAEPSGQLEMIRHTVAAVGWNQGELHYRLAPMIREIAAARLSRRYGVDLDRQPEQARALIGGGRVWELAGPARVPPENRYERGWSRRELEELLDELEGI